MLLYCGRRKVYAWLLSDETMEATYLNADHQCSWKCCMEGRHTAKGPSQYKRPLKPRLQRIVAESSHFVMPTSYTDVCVLWRFTCLMLLSSGTVWHMVCKAVDRCQSLSTKDESKLSCEQFDMSPCRIVSWHDCDLSEKAYIFAI
jgi:hypothetical protein